MATIGEVLEGMAEQKWPRPRRQGLTPSKKAELLHEMGRPYPEQHTHDDEQYWPSWSDEFGTPELPEPTIQEGTTMRTCTATNSKNQPCKAHVVPETEQCRYHPQQVAVAPAPARVTTFITRTKDGPEAIKAALYDSLHNGTAVDTAFATFGRGPNKRVPKWRGSRFVKRITPNGKSEDVVFSDNKLASIDNIWFASPSA